jgi:hypothetical protein
MSDVVLGTLLIINRIATAGNAITAFSLMLYSLTFNLREKIARILAQLMACVTIVYFMDILASTAQSNGEMALWLRLQWLGIAFVPASYLHLSDALLAATGRPSRGRRRAIGFFSYMLGGAIVLIAGFTNLLAGELHIAGLAGYLIPGPLFPLFALFIFGALAVSGLNYWRSYRRCLTRTSKRRMRYLMIGSLGPILATFPFLMLADDTGMMFPFLFWTALIVITIGVAGMLVLMTYTIAYFGVSYPDRVVKGRLFQWILRGPVVASTVLAITVVANRIAIRLNLEDSRLVPFTMVASLLLLQYLITLIRQPIERWLFYGQDRKDLVRLHRLEDRLLTTSDLRQFLESILNAACDITNATSAFIAAMGKEGLELEVAVGPEDPLRTSEDLPPVLMAGRNRKIENLGTLFIWDHYWLLPLKDQESSEEILGIMGFRAWSEEPEFSPEQAASVRILADRALVALSDRLFQRDVFLAMDRIVPQMEEIHRIRAASRYIGSEGQISPMGASGTEANLIQWVRDALTHYWGGPRLTESPLLRLHIVRDALDQHEGNPVNALRAILHEAIERIRPAGERRFTAEWMLYNILEMKFLEGRKVRDVAMRLAMSEADLYRKQRVALEAVTKAIAEMERDASKGGEGKEAA